MPSTATSTLSGGDYNASFDGRFDPNSGLRQGGVSDRQRDRMVREEHERLRRQGWEPCTVINLLPFALSVNLGELGLLEVPAATAQTPIQRLVIQDYRLSMRDMGDGNFAPLSVLPAELAKEVEREYFDTGGVFWFRGIGDPSENALRTGKARMDAYWRREFQKAVDSWSRYHQHKFITDRQRDAARALFAAGEMAALPEWVTATKAQSNLKACPDCGEDCRAGARICRHCRYQFAPADGAAKAAGEAEELGAPSLAGGAGK